MVGNKIIPTAPPYDWSSNGPQDQEVGPDYLYIPLSKFIDLMREKYEDWEYFMYDRPGLYRTLMSDEDLEW